MVTRKLRRRPHDPLPAVEKRRKLTPLSSLVYVLDEGEVDEDLKVIFKARGNDLIGNVLTMQYHYYCRVKYRRPIRILLQVIMQKCSAQKNIFAKSYKSIMNMLCFQFRWR